MKNYKLAELIAIGMITTMGAHQVFAQEVRGGGQGTEQNGQLKLMDTIDGLSQTGRCTWKPMSEVLAQYPASLDVLKKLESVHAYAAFASRAAAARITVCFGGELKPLRREDKGSVFVRVNQKLQTIAYRWNQKVLVDPGKLAQLSPVDQGMLFVHEIAHSFIPVDVKQSGGHIAQNDFPTPTIFEAVDATVFPRCDRLWSFVNAIYRNYVSGISTQEFALAITQNGAILPENDLFWKKNAAEYALSLDRTAPKKERIVAISKIDFKEAKANLVPEDSHEIEYFLNTWYATPIAIMKDRNYGWEAALRNQIETFGFDPLQVLPNGQSLLTNAIDAQDPNAVSLLLNYPMQTKDRAIRVRFFNAILEKKVILDNPNSILAQFDPNEGELILTNENGIQTHHGESSFFLLAIEKGNLEIASTFFKSGKVRNDVLSQGFEALMKLDMGYENYETNPVQDERRDFMKSILKAEGFMPRHEALFNAVQVQNEYAINTLLDVITPTKDELFQFTLNPWSLGLGKTVFVKALTKAKDAINSRNRDGYRMVDFAIQSRSDELFDLLIGAGANEFRKSYNNNEQDWVIARLIETSATKTLSAYFDQNNYNNKLALLKQLDLANIRLKANSAKVIQDRLNSIHN